MFVVDGQDRAGAVLGFQVGDKVTYGMMAVVRYDTYVIHIFVTARSQIPAVFVSDLAVIAARKLEAQPA